MLLACWLLGLATLLARATTRTRAERDGTLPTVGRAVVAIDLVIVTLLAASAPWVWGGQQASDGLAQARRTRSSAQLVQPTLRTDRVEVAVVIGPGGERDDEATLHVPAALVPVVVTGPLGHLRRVGAGVTATAAPDPAGARLRVVRLDGERDQIEGRALAAACAQPAPGAPVADRSATGAEVALVACVGVVPHLALRVRPAGDGLEVAPRVRRGGRLQAPALAVAAGGNARLGEGAEVPGLSTWLLPRLGPAGEVVLVPVDLTRCDGWRTAVVGATPGVTRTRADRCRIELAGLSFDVVATAPAPGLVVRRGALAAVVLVGPLGLALLLLLVSRRSRRTGARVAALVRVALIAVALIAVACWRLTWAYRLDALRATVDGGGAVGRVEDNLRLVGLVAAVLAGLVLAALAPRLQPRALVVRLGAAVLTLVVASVVLAAPAWASPRWWAQAAFAALIIAGAGAGAGVGTARARGDDGGARSPAPRSRASTYAPWLVALATVGLSQVPGHQVTLTLLLAYAAVLAGYLAVRATAIPAPARWTGPLAGVVVMVIASLRHDTGVACAIVLPGLGAAVLLVAYDGWYDAGRRHLLGSVEGDHPALLRAHAIAAIALSALVSTWLLTRDDATLLAGASRGWLAAPWLLVGAFAVGAVVAWRRRRRVGPWLVGGALALATLVARGPVLERAWHSERVAGQRLAALLAPGYALLRDPEQFLATAGAWREAAAPSAQRTEPGQVPALDPLAGQGYFAARIVDRGVRASIDNDYLPVLVGREVGAVGVTATLVLLLLCAGTLVAGASAHPAGTAQARARLVLAGALTAVALYQPLAALGLVPLTGISWPGFGIDSPSDLWVLVLAMAWASAPVTATARREAHLTTSPAVRAARRWVAFAGLAVGLTATLLVARATVAALRRPVASLLTDDPRLAAAVTYLRDLRCPTPPDPTGPLVLAPPVAAPTDPVLARFHHQLLEAWRPSAAQAALTRHLAGDPAGCSGGDTRWTLGPTPTGDGCDARFRFGAVAVRWTTEPGPGGAMTARCELEPATAITLPGPPPPAPPRPVRLVATALGVAALDLGELQAGAAVVRLRPGAAPASAEAGPRRQLASARVALGPRTVVATTEDGRVVVTDAAAVLVADGEGWRRLATTPTTLDRAALVLPLGRPGVVWSFRPTRSWGTAAPVVDPLLADDVSTSGGDRRLYPHGDDVPMVGWRNPLAPLRSYGLDGWVAAALASPAAPPASADASCGAVAAPRPRRDQVCSPSPHDGVLECRVSVQPELVATLRQRLVAATTPGPGAPPTRAALALMRGDTGEVLAVVDHDPTRAPSAFAPTTALAERALTRLLDDRDPATGAPTAPGTGRGEEAPWNQAIAIGSTLKPMLARAAELAAPDHTRALVLRVDGATGPGQVCPRRRGPATTALLGYCPPTPLVDHADTADLHGYLARSLNWFHAGLGLLALDWPRAATPVDALDAWSRDRPLTIEGGVLLGSRGVRIDSLRATPLWRRFEQVLGRPLCTDGDKATCQRAGDRRDLCAARALPVPAPSAALRYLVATGPDRFDVYGDDRPDQRRVPVGEYLQFLRGSGVHPVGSLLQLADAFARVLYDEPDPDGHHHLAASWFPAPAVAAAPAWDCGQATTAAATVRGADGGLCGAVRPGGTAHRALAPVLADPRVRLHGAKTGTIDALAEVATSPRRCKAWNRRHTLPGRPAEAAAQPYWMRCGQAPADDTLLVVGFSLATPSGQVPLALAILVQRGGKGAAAALAPGLIDDVRAYLAPALP